MNSTSNMNDICKLQINCYLFESNLSYYYSLHVGLIKYSPIFWLTSIISFIGLFNNMVILIIFYRLKWFKNDQMLFFINGTIVDFVECLANFFVNIYFVISLLWPLKYGISSQLTCVALTVLIKIPSACVGRFCFVIAFDRLLAQWYPAKWYQMGKLYHWTVVSIVWLWAIVQEGGWLFFIKNEQCVVACLGYSSYPKVPTWTLFSTIGDMSMAISTIIIYIFIPILTWLTFNSCVNSMIERNNSVFFCRQILNRIRLISLIMIPCFLCTIVIGAMISDFSNDCVFNSTKSLIYPAIGNLFLNFSSVIVPYVYFADAIFRAETLKLISNLNIWLKKK